MKTGENGEELELELRELLSLHFVGRVSHVGNSKVLPLPEGLVERLANVHQVRVPRGKEEETAEEKEYYHS